MVAVHLERHRGRSRGRSTPSGHQPTTTAIPPALLTPDGILALQRTAGNAAVTAALQASSRLQVQRKGSAADKIRRRLVDTSIENRKLTDWVNEHAPAIKRSDNIDIADMSDKKSLAYRLHQVFVDLEDEHDKPSPDEGVLEKAQYDQQFLAKEVALYSKYEKGEQPAGKRGVSWLKSTGKSLGKAALGLGQAAIKAAFGPLYRAVIMMFSPKERKKFAADLVKYIDVMRSRGDLRGGNSPMNAIYGAIGFFANTFLDQMAGLAGWLMLLTGVVGLLPGAQAALGLAAIFGSVATIAALGKAGLNGILAVWSGIQTYRLYRRLSDDFKTPQERKNRDRYLASLGELGTNITNTVSGARDVAVVAATGGVSGAMAGDSTKGFTSKMEGYYGSAFDPGAYTKAVGQVDRTFKVSSSEYAAFSPEDKAKYDAASPAGKKAIAIGMAREGVTGTGQMKDDVWAAAAVEGLSKNGGGGKVYLKKSELPKPGKTIRKAVLDGLGPINRIVAAAKHMWKGMKLVKDGVLWVVSKLKGLVSAPAAITDEGMDDATNTVDAADSLQGTVQDLGDLVSVE